MYSVPHCKCFHSNARKSVMLIAACCCAGEQENSKNPTRITMARLANALGHCNQFERADQLFRQAMLQPAAPIGASPQAVADVSDAVLLTCRAVLSVRESHALRAGGDGAAEVEGQATLTSVRELLEQAIALTVAEQSEDYVTYPEEVLQSIEALVDTAAGSMDDLTAQLTGVDVGATPARCACSRRRTGSRTRPGGASRRAVLRPLRSTSRRSCAGAGATSCVERAVQQPRASEDPISQRKCDIQCSGSASRVLQCA